MAGLALLEPDSEVVYADPPFALYPLTATLMNCRPVPVPAKNLAHDLDAMADACTDQTRLIFISNPYNPCGTIVRQAEVDRFLDRVPETAVVVLDEAYAEYVDDPDYPRSLEYVREGRSVLVLRHFQQDLRPGGPAHRLWLRAAGAGDGPQASLRALQREQRWPRPRGAGQPGRSQPGHAFPADGLGGPPVLL